MANQNSTIDADNTVTLNGRDNVLSQYDNVTYNFCFFLSESSYNPKSKSEAPKYKAIIAETGSTLDYVIGDVEFTHWAGPGYPNKNTSAFKGSMTIYEPGGFSLIDSIYKTAKYIGIENYSLAPFFLDISFKGVRNTSGNLISIPDTRRLYRIRISNITASYTSQGTTYEVSFISYDDTAFTDRYARFDRQFDITKVSNVGEFFDKFQTVVNEYMASKYADGIGKPDEYVFEVDSKIRAKALRSQDSGTKESSMQNATLTYDPLKTTATVPSGVSIGDVVNSLMASVESDLGQDTNNKEKDFTKIWYINSEINPIQYDTSRQDNAYRIKYIINYYSTVQGITNAEYVDKINKSKSSQEKRQQVLEIKKIYNYTYTGLNTEVLDFEVNLDKLWYATVPVYNGKGSQATNANTVKGLKDEVRIIDSPKSGSSATPNPQSNTTTNTSNSKKTFYASQMKDNISTINSTPLPATVVHTADANEREYVGVIEPTTKNYVSITNAILNQIYDRSQMVSIELDIKGDPYWLSGAKLIYGDINMRTDRDELFIIKFSTPNIALNSNGVMNLTPDSTISGAFAVQRVETTFSGGQFKQRLIAVRDLLTNINYMK